MVEPVTCLAPRDPRIARRKSRVAYRDQLQVVTHLVLNGVGASGGDECNF